MPSRSARYGPSLTHHTRLPVFFCCAKTSRGASRSIISNGSSSASQSEVHRKARPTRGTAALGPCIVQWQWLTLSGGGHWYAPVKLFSSPLCVPTPLLHPMAPFTLESGLAFLQAGNLIFQNFALCSRAVPAPGNLDPAVFMFLSAPECTMPASSEVRRESPTAQLEMRREPRETAEQVMRRESQLGAKPRRTRR